MQNRKISAPLQALFPPRGVFPHPALADSRLPKHNRKQRGVHAVEIGAFPDPHGGATLDILTFGVVRVYLRLPEVELFEMLACTSSILLPEISLAFGRNFGYNFLVRYLVSLRTVLQLKNASFLQFPAGTLFPFDTVMALLGARTVLHSPLFEYRKLDFLILDVFLGNLPFLHFCSGHLYAGSGGGR